MKKIILLTITMIICLIFTLHAQSRADKYWKGANASSDNISFGDNWWSGSNPTSGDNLYFNNTVTRHWVYSNYGTGSWFSNIITYSGAGGIKLYGDNTYAFKFENNSDGSLLELSPSSATAGNREIGNRIDNDLELNPVGSGGILVSCDRISLDNTNGARSLKVYGGNTLTIDGYIYEINGTGATFQLLGAATVILKGNSTYTGSTTVAAGTLELQGSIANSNVIVNSGATLKINGDNVTIKNLTVNSGGIVEVLANKSFIVDGSDYVFNGTTTIRSGGSMIINGADAEAFSSFTIENGAELTINGSSVTFGSDFIIESNIDGTGSFIVNGVTSGNITVKRYIPAWGTGLQGWHLLSSPVASQAFQSTFIPNPPTASEDFYLWDETTNFWINSKIGTEPPFTFSGAFGTNFGVGEGYLVSYNSLVTKEFIGIPNYNDVTDIALSYTSTSGRKGLNLLGNPYPSGIVWNVETWKPGNSVISGVAKIISSTDASYIDIEASGIIPAMNGFFVYTTEATTLTIPKSAKTHAGSWYKKPTTSQKITLTAVDIDGKTAQNSIISINPNSSFNFDLLYDGEFAPFYAPTFYSVMGEYQLSTNSIPSIEENMIVYFNFEKNNGSNFRIDISGINEMGEVAYLLDKKTGIVTDLSISNSYYFTAEIDDDHKRFELHFSPVGIGEGYNKYNELQVWSFNNKINIINNNNFHGAINIMNIVGQIVDSYALNGNNQQEINFNGPSGVYIVNIITKDGVNVSNKVIITN